jgi:hypothetical protein
MENRFEMNTAEDQISRIASATPIAPLELIGPLPTTLQWALAIVVVDLDDPKRAGRKSFPRVRDADFALRHTTLRHCNAQRGSNFRAAGHRAARLETVFFTSQSRLQPAIPRFTDWPIGERIPTAATNYNREEPNPLQNRAI